MNFFNRRSSDTRKLCLQFIMFEHKLSSLKFKVLEMSVVALLCDTQQIVCWTICVHICKSEYVGV